jgi:lysophospholipase L1-like esterase
MQTIVTTCAALYPGAFLLMTPIASSAATVVPVANQLPYVAALQAIAENSEIPLLDIYSPTPWLLAKSLGYTFDGAHRNAAGYSDLAARVYAAIGPNGS